MRTKSRRESMSRMSILRLTLKQLVWLLTVKDKIRVITTVTQEFTSTSSNKNWFLGMCVDVAVVKVITSKTAQRIMTQPTILIKVKECLNLNSGAETLESTQKSSLTANTKFSDK